MKKRLKPSQNDSYAAAAAGSGGGGGAAVDSKRDYKSESLSPLSKLSVTGVSDYLRSTAPAYAAYIQPFTDNGINGAALCELTDADLKDLLGVSNKLHRMRLVSDIKSARAVPSVGSTAAGSGSGRADSAAAAATGGGGGGGGGGGVDSSRAEHNSQSSAAAAAAAAATENKLCVVCLTATKSLCFSAVTSVAVRNVAMRKR